MEHVVVVRRYGAVIFLQIRHSARTWGVDIESLLTGHVNAMLKEEPKLKRFVYDHSGLIGLIVGLVFLSMTVVGSFVWTNHFVESQLRAARTVMQNSASSAEALGIRLNFLIERTVSGEWTRFLFALAIFVFVSGVLSIVFGIWTSSAAENRPSSFVLLSKRAEDEKVKALAMREHGWLQFVGSIIVMVITGICANALFNVWFLPWLE